MRAFDIQNYRDLNTRTVAFKAGSLTANDIGKAVTLVDDLTVGLGSDGGVLIGKLEYVGNGLATVFTGEVTLYDAVSASVTVGSLVVVNGAGKVRNATGSDTGPKRGIILAVEPTTHLVAVLT